ncbi:MAG: ABC transporter, partial [Alphaproteobacteria bacterium]|nr:ABC transporter [Alphaproteobacteria bacterium]
MADSKNDRAPSRDLRVLRRLFGLLKPYRGRVALAGISLTLAAGAVLGLGTALRWLVDAGFAAGNADLLDHALLGLFAFVLLLAGATYARSYRVTGRGNRVTADIRRLVFERALTLSPAYYETTRTGEVVSRLTADTATVQTIVGSSASMALRNVLLFAGGVAMMAIASPKLTAVALLVVPLVVGPLIFFGRKVRALSRESQDRLGDVGADIEESLAAIRTVQAFNRERADGERFGARVEDAFGANVRRAKARSALIAMVMLSVFGAVGFVLWIGGRDAIAGPITAGQLLAFVVYALVVAASVGALHGIAAHLQSAAGGGGTPFRPPDAGPGSPGPSSPVADAQ